MANKKQKFLTARGKPAILKPDTVNTETSAFQEAKPRTARAEVRHRERKIMDAMEDLVDLDDEEAYKRVLAEKFGIKPGNPRYQKAIATWAEIRRART